MSSCAYCFTCPEKYTHRLFSETDLVVQNNKKTRICILMGGHFSKTIGGAQYQAKCITDELINRGEFEVIYLARAIDASYSPEGYEIMKISDHSGIRKYSFVFDTLCLFKLLKEIQPDVIYQRGLKAYTGIAAYYAKQYTCRLIFHVAHDYDVLPLQLSSLKWRLPLDIIEKKFGEYGLRNATSIVAQTQYQSDRLFENYGKKADMVIPNMHPLPKDNINKATDTVKVVWVANFKSTKRPELFVRLADELQGIEGVEFVMIGRPGDSGKYGALHEHIARLKNMSYLGERPISEVNSVLAESHIFVNTSLSEGFPNTFIQAWMRKVPVLSVSIDVDGVLDAFDVGRFVGGFRGLKEATLNLIKHPDIRREMGERAQRYAFNHHSTSNIEKLISIIKA